MLMKLLIIITVLTGTVAVGLRAYTLYCHRGCQVMRKPSWINNKWFLTGMSLILWTLMAAAFWPELTKLGVELKFYDEEIILNNLIIVLLLAYGYYLALRKMVAQLKHLSYANARAAANSQVRKCRYRCYNAESGATSRLHCRNLNMQVCPCADEWDVRTEVWKSDVRSAIEKANLNAFGSAEITVPSSRVVHKAAEPSRLLSDIEQAYMGQIIRLIATQLPDGRVKRELREEDVKTFRVR